MGSLDPNYDQSPAAVVGRPGESQSQTHSRFSGLSDDETGYVAPLPQYTGRRGARLQQSRQPSNRADALAIQQQRINGTQQRFEDRYNLQQQEQALKEKEFDLHDKIHAHALADKQAVLDQTSGFLNSLDQISQGQDSPRGSKNFLTKALAVAGQYPAAIASNARLSEMTKNFETDLHKMGGNLDSVYMLSELGQADLKDPNTLDYLRTLPGKYAGAVNDKGTMTIFADTLKAAYQANPQAQAPDGTVMKQQTITGPGGSMVVEPAAVAAAKLTAAQAKLQNSQLNQAQRTLDSAVALRARLKDSAGADVLKLADDHINQAKENLNGLKSQLTPTAQPQTEGDRPPDTGDAAAPKLNPLSDDIAASARAAISAGKDPAAVKQRLQEKGFDPAGL